METVAIQTKFLGPTNSRGARIVATTCNGHRIVRQYDYAAGRKSHAIVAAELARTMGWTGQLVCGGTATGYVFVSDETSTAYAVATGKESYRD